MLKQVGVRVAAVATLAVVAAAGCRSVEPLDFEPGPMGAVTIDAGEPIQIRTLAAVTVTPALGAVARHGTELAIRDMGEVLGRKVELGDPVDAMCTPEGGRAGALRIVGDRKVLGIVGTSCSAAAVEAARVVSEAGLVMISPSNTSPALTSDLAGNANPAHQPGYYRTSVNDLHQARALAHFLYADLGLRRVPAVHDGDVYTTALVAAFRDAFIDFGGEVPVTVAVDKKQTEMANEMAALAAVNPDGIFFPLFPLEGTAFTRQARAHDGLKSATLVSGGALLVAEFLAVPESEGMYFSAAASDFDANVNSVTDKSGEAVRAAYEAAYGGAPPSLYWAHAYDAATLLLSSIAAVAVEDGSRAHMDRTALRKRLTTATMDGLIGKVSCDEFGDCGTKRIDVYHHTDSNVTDVSKLKIVHRYDGG